jgi:hypothetical protein
MSAEMYDGIFQKARNLDTSKITVECFAYLRV